MNQHSFSIGMDYSTSKMKWFKQLFYAHERPSKINILVLITFCTQLQALLGYKFVRRLACLLLLFFAIGTFECSADIKSTTGNINFDTNRDGQSEATLSTTGLAIDAGNSPSANLHVQGNSIISTTLSVGRTQSSANLTVNGTIGYSFSTLTGNTTLDTLNSTYLVDSSLGNVYIDLPDPAPHEGQIIMLKKTSTSNQVFFAGHPVDGVYGYTMTSGKMGCLRLIAFSSNWSILSLFDY